MLSLCFLPDILDILDDQQFNYDYHYLITCTKSVDLTITSTAVPISPNNTNSNKTIKTRPATPNTDSEYRLFLHYRLNRPFFSCPPITRLQVVVASDAASGTEASVHSPSLYSDEEYFSAAGVSKSRYCLASSSTSLVRSLPFPWLLIRGAEAGSS